MSRPAVGATDRFGATLVFSLIAHAILALGIGFAPEPEAPPALPSLDVILVQTRSEKSPDKADFLAQANQQGGGESERAVRPTQTVSSAVPKPEIGVAPRPIEASAPKASPRKPEELLTTQRADVRVRTSNRAPENRKEDLPDGRELMQRSLEMARLAAEINRTNEAYSKRPKRKFISANTREYEYASYMAAWVAKVERVGNLNYPDQARREGLSGDLVLTVAIRRDGSIEAVDIIQPSGQKVLDDAAIRIVNMAGPFAPIPDVKGDAVDILHITRTWQFLPGNILRGK